MEGFCLLEQWPGELSGLLANWTCGSQLIFYCGTVWAMVVFFMLATSVCPFFFGFLVLCLSSVKWCVMLSERLAFFMVAFLCQFLRHSFWSSGLAPGTVYRVTIATKPASGTYGERHKWSQDKVSCNIEFKTLVGGGKYVRGKSSLSSSDF